MNNENKGLLVVISGPAGSGKGTVVDLVRKKSERIGLSISATTRAPRAMDAEGVTYYFLSREEFEKRIASGEMLEYTQYCENYYGTPRAEVERVLSAGDDLILEIEVDGAMQVKKKMPGAITIMLLPPTYAVLEARLRGRGTETEDVILQRLDRAKKELLLYENYDYVVINDEGKADASADRILAILEAERCKTARKTTLLNDFFERN